MIYQVIFCSTTVEPSERNRSETIKEAVTNELLEFSKFDINRVLKHGERLVGSSGAEYDLPEEDLIGKKYDLSQI